MGKELHMRDQRVVSRLVIVWEMLWQGGSNPTLRHLLEQILDTDSKWNEVKIRDLLDSLK